MGVFAAAAAARCGGDLPAFINGAIGVKSATGPDLCVRGCGQPQQQDEA
jgi:hypothetical protein